MELLFKTKNKTKVIFLYIKKKRDNRGEIKKLILVNFNAIPVKLCVRVCVCV